MAELKPLLPLRMEPSSPWWKVGGGRPQPTGQMPGSLPRRTSASGVGGTALHDLAGLCFPMVSISSPP